MKPIGEHELLIFLLQVFLLLITARTLGELFRNLRQPSVIGELLTGIILGPTILGNISPAIFRWLFPGATPQPQMLEIMAWMGVLLLLLVAGMEIDISVVWRQGRPAIATSIMGIIVPFSSGFILGLIIPPTYLVNPEHRLLFSLFLGTALSISALPVIARILMDLDLLKTDLGMITVAAALFNDLVGWIIFSIILGLMSGVGASLTGLTEIASLTLGFALFCFTIGRWAIDKILDWAQIILPWPTGVLTLALGVTLLCSAITQWIGIHAVFGAFLAGVMIGDSPHLRERTRETISEFTASVFAPLFFATVGLKVNLLQSFNPVLVLALFTVACLGKLVGCNLGARWGGMSREDALCVSFGMNARGAMEIILALLAFKYGLIGDEIFVALLIIAVVTSLMAGPLMKWSLRRRVLPDILTFFPANSVLYQLRATTREGIIQELISKVMDGSKLGLEKEEVIKAVIQREESMGTGVGGGVAFPHARLAGLDKPLLAFGRSRSGIDFNAPDGRLVHLIFLILTPIEDEGAQLKILSAIARAVESPANKERLLAARNFTEFRGALAEQLKGGV